MVDLQTFQGMYLELSRFEDFKALKVSRFQGFKVHNTVRNLNRYL